MNNFNLKSLVLGIGIGIVFTSIISMVYLAGNEPKLSKEEIIKQAEKYGMVQKTEIVSTQLPSSQTPEKKITDASKEVGKSTEIKDNSLLPQKAEPENKSEPKEPVKEPVDENVIIVINRGDTSEIVADRLLKAGLIDEKAVFIKEIVSQGRANDINVGSFKIKKGTDVKGIVKILTTYS